MSIMMLVFFSLVLPLVAATLGFILLEQRRRQMSAAARRAAQLFLGVFTALVAVGVLGAGLVL